MTRTPSVWKAALSGALAALLTFSAPSFALGPFERNHPAVEEGLTAYEQGDYATALQQFEEAKKELPQSSAVEFNRGNALYKLGNHAEAVSAYQRAAELDKGELRQQDYYNLGNTFAAMGKREEALAAYRRALMLNPSDMQARQNMEIVLRDLPPPTPPQQSPDGGPSDGGQDGGSPDAGSDGGQTGDGGQDGGGQDGGADGGQDGGNADGGRGDAGQGDAGQGDGGQGDGGQGDAGDRGDGGDKPGDGEGEGEDGGTSDGGTESEESEVREEPSDGGASLPDELSKEDAEKLLDAMKQNDRNLQLWRFQKKKPRKPNDKDW